MTRDSFGPSGSVSIDTFRQVMSRFAASVTVVTTAADDKMHGMTATAVCSVSDDPPSLLVVINRSGRSHRLICLSGVFAVNVLSFHQIELAAYFASTEAKSLDAVDFYRGVTCAPVLADGQAFAECEVAAQLDFGTHSIFVGRIVAAQYRDVAPLIYHGRQFRALG